MQDYDTVLKVLLQHSPNTLLTQLTGSAITHWHNVELPRTEQPRVDLLGESGAGELIHIELQSRNDPLMAVRMAEYSLRVYRLFQRFARQIVLYVGAAPLDMAEELRGPQQVYRYTLIDMRSLTAEPLLASAWPSDNILAILTNLRNRQQAVRQILQKIATLEPGAREAALARLVILAGLRKLGEVIGTEVKTMPILDSILDHDLLGPAMRQGLEKGLQQGLEQGRQQESLSLARRLLEKRFGALPPAVEQQLGRLSVGELEGLLLRLLDAASLEELFKS